MVKYVARRPRAGSYYDYDAECDVDQPGTISIVEDAYEAVPTGLLDAAGNELYRYPERHPIGFHVKQRVDG